MELQILFHKRLWPQAEIISALGCRAITLSRRDDFLYIIGDGQFLGWLGIIDYVSRPSEFHDLLRYSPGDAIYNGRKIEWRDAGSRKAQL